MPPEIDYSRCSGCGTCVNVCAEDVFFGTKGFGLKGEKPTITYPDVCYHCYLCVKECPTQAISLRTPLPQYVPFK
jgi:adenylylsulfate reductase subunit B